MTPRTDPIGYLSPDEHAELRQLNDTLEASKRALAEAQSIVDEDGTLLRAFVVRLKRRYNLEATDAIDLDTGAIKATSGPPDGPATPERRRASSGRAGNGGGGLRPDRRSRLRPAGDNANPDANAGAGEVESEHDGRPNDLSGGG